MKQALLVAKEIKRLRTAINKSRSRYLINDYSKQVNYLTKELKFYCDNKGINFKELLKEVF